MRVGATPNVNGIDRRPGWRSQTSPVKGGGFTCARCYFWRLIVPDIVTVILRLVLGDDAPERFHGTVQTLEEEEPRFFGSESELLEILERVMKAAKGREVQRTK